MLEEESFDDVIAPNKRIWTPEEDDRLKQLVEEHGTGNWSLIGDFFVDRTGKQCRERWTNHLRPDLKKGEWTEEEDRIIMTMQQTIGNQWAKITKMLPGRTDNAVKNRFHIAIRPQKRAPARPNTTTEEYQRITAMVMKGGLSSSSRQHQGNRTKKVAPTPTLLPPVQTAASASAHGFVGMGLGGFSGQDAHVTHGFYRADLGSDSVDGFSVSGSSQPVGEGHRFASGGEGREFAIGGGHHDAYLRPHGMPSAAATVAATNDFGEELLQAPLSQYQEGIATVHQSMLPNNEFSSTSYPHESFNNMHQIRTDLPPQTFAQRPHEPHLSVTVPVVPVVRSSSSGQTYEYVPQESFAYQPAPSYASIDGAAVPDNSALYRSTSAYYAPSMLNGTDGVSQSQPRDGGEEYMQSLRTDPPSSSIGIRSSQFYESSAPRTDGNFLAPDRMATAFSASQHPHDHQQRPQHDHQRPQRSPPYYVIPQPLAFHPSGYNTVSAAEGFPSHHQQHQRQGAGGDLNGDAPQDHSNHHFLANSFSATLVPNHQATEVMERGLLGSGGSQDSDSTMTTRMQAPSWQQMMPPSGIIEVASASQEGLLPAGGHSAGEEAEGEGIGEDEVEDGEEAEEEEEDEEVAAAFGNTEMRRGYSYHDNEKEEGVEEDNDDEAVVGAPSPLALPAAVATDDARNSTYAYPLPVLEECPSPSIFNAPSTNSSGKANKEVGKSSSSQEQEPRRHRHHRQQRHHQHPLVRVEKMGGDDESLQVEDFDWVDADRAMEALHPLPLVNDDLGHGMPTSPQQGDSDGDGAQQSSHGSGSSKGTNATQDGADIKLRGFSPAGSDGSNNSKERERRKGEGRAGVAAADDANTDTPPHEYDIMLGEEGVRNQPISTAKKQHKIRAVTTAHAAVMAAATVAPASPSAAAAATTSNEIPVVGSSRCLPGGAASSVVEWATSSILGYNDSEEMRHAGFYFGAFKGWSSSSSSSQKQDRKKARVVPSPPEFMRHRESSCVVVPVVPLNGEEKQRSQTHDMVAGQNDRRTESNGDHPSDFRDHP